MRSACASVRSAIRELQGVLGSLNCRAPPKRSTKRTRTASNSEGGWASPAYGSSSTSSNKRNGSSSTSSNKRTRTASNARRNNGWMSWNKALKQGLLKTRRRSTSRNSNPGGWTAIQNVLPRGSTPPRRRSASRSRSPPKKKRAMLDLYRP